MMTRRLVFGLAMWLVASRALVQVEQKPDPTESCFLLYDEQTQTVTRDPSTACATRATPASTFKIPHALAALDAGVIGGPDERFAYDRTAYETERWRHDHDLRTAMRDSVVWYFQRLAERLGSAREQRYVEAFDYGNRDARGPLTTFWLGSSLQISPDEQLAFLQRFFAGRLPVKESAARTVREILVQPNGHIVSALGAQPLGRAWPAGTTVYAKTGRGADGDRRVAWLVGRVTRGDRAWLFVSCVLRSPDPQAAVALAAERLARAKVL